MHIYDFYQKKNKNIIQISGLVPFMNVSKSPPQAPLSFHFWGSGGRSSEQNVLKRFFDLFSKSQEKGLVLLTLFQDHRIGV